MKLLQLIGFLQKHSRAVARVCLVILAMLVIADAIPGWVGKEHAHTAPERFPAFWAAFGFFGCVAIILLSKAFGHAGIMKREDYYDE